MNQVKSKLSSDQSPEEKTKKLQNEFDLSITCIENLSNEFFYEIFDYLDGFKIYAAFSNLNYRFQQLLNSSYLLFKLKFYSISHEPYTNDFEQFIFANRHKIFSMDIKIPYDNRQLFPSFTIDSSLNRLESLDLYHIEPDILISFLENFASLPRLFSLTIEIWHIKPNLHDIYRLIFALRSLKYNKLYLYGDNSPISRPMTMNKQFSTIEHLVIDHSCTFNELSAIISHTPQLRRLNFLHRKKNNSSVRTMLPITLLNLTDIFTDVSQITFDEFEIFIKKIYSKLKVLCVITRSKDLTFLNAHRWERLILQYLPQLENFCLQYYEEIGDDWTYPIYSGGLNQFSSSFWIERQWTFQADITGDRIKYSVRPYRKRWYDYTQDMIANSSIERSKSNRLNLEYFDSDDEDDEASSVHIRRVLTVAQIHHLEILQEKSSIRTLIKTTNLLSELNTLQICSLSLDRLRELCAEELSIICSTKNTSKITKVCLEKMVDIEEVYFLIGLCPYLAYLKVGYLNNMDVELFVRNILTKMNHDGNNYLRRLCFHVPAADDKTIKTLEKMINVEKLLVDYTITRVLDNIYLHWK